MIAWSSAEEEFKAMIYGICKGLRLQTMIKELRIPSNYSIKALWDNKGTISIAKNSVHHDKTKHVKINHHFIKEKN